MNAEGIPNNEILDKKITSRVATVPVLFRQNLNSAGYEFNFFINTYIYK
jgi:hypothetical protein